MKTEGQLGEGGGGGEGGADVDHGHGWLSVQRLSGVVAQLQLPGHHAVQPEGGGGGHHCGGLALLDDGGEPGELPVRLPLARLMGFLRSLGGPW